MSSPKMNKQKLLDIEDKNLRCAGCRWWRPMDHYQTVGVCHYQKRTDMQPSLFAGYIDGVFKVSDEYGLLTNYTSSCRFNNWSVCYDS